MKRSLLAGIVVPVLVAGALSAAPPSAVSVPAPATAPSRLSPDQAAAQAKATHRSVVVGTLTTPTSETTVNPSGEFTDTETLSPARVWRAGAWHELDADLHATGRGTIVPAATTDTVTLSDGGSAPLVVLDSAGRTMSLFWPRPLPEPTLRGATATYADVLAGVDLDVTVTPQGGFTDVLVVRDAAAAANPALRSIRLRVSAPGMRVSEDTAGNISVATSTRAEPVFTTPPARQWDSAPPRPGMTTAPSGAPAYSSQAGPGAAAKVAQVPVSVSGDTITVRPAVSARGLRFPVYIDPDFVSDPVAGKVSGWTQVDSGFPTTNFLNETSDLQVGKCDDSAGGCNGLGVARSFVRMPISTELTSTTVVDSATLSMNDVWSDSCTKEPVQLWTTGGLSSTTSWNVQPAWDTELQTQSFAFGFGASCGSFKNDVTWTVTSTIQADAGTKVGQTFGLRAGSETATLDWKQFASGTGNTTLSTSFHTVPSTPANLTNSPAGACATTAASAATIGDNDVTLAAMVGDTDDGNGDATLNTTFTLRNQPAGTTAFSTTVSSGNVSGGQTVSLTIPRATMQGLNANGATTPFTYSWSASTQDTATPVLTSPTSETCFFTYDPTVSASPGVSLLSASGQIGSSVQVTFTTPTGCTGTACPTSYTYQLGVAAAVTVVPNNSPAAGDWTGNVTINQFGPQQLRVYGSTSGGNIGPATSQQLTGTAPTTPYRDGYYTGGAFPSLLSQGTGKDPSLWLSTGTGAGTLAAPVDIGSVGTMINPGTDGPADWAGAQVLHGNLIGRGLQDVLAYYPAAGAGVLIGGSGTANPLLPTGLNAFAFPGGTLSDPTFANPADNPMTLVAAGDASELCAGLDDLVGVVGDATSGYELDLFTAGSPFGFNAPGGYAFAQVLATTAPDGTADWNNYTLATAQPTDSADRTGCATGAASDPNDVELFALNKATGALYLSTNPNVNADQSVTPATGTPVGSGTWSRLTVPWGATAPKLVSADVNAAGSAELWTLASAVATPYTVSGTTVTKEGTGTPVKLPTDDWQLTDGNTDANAGATAAVDSITGRTAALTGNAGWRDDDYFGTVLALDGASGYASPTVGTVSAADPTISLWFNTSLLPGQDGVLASVQASAPSSGASTTGALDPVLYVGTDGKLRGLWYQGASASLITSTHAVTDGGWHHVVLSTSGTTQTMTVDGVVQGTATGTVNVTTMPNFELGVGYIGGHWPAETHASSTSGIGFLSYFAGDIADVTYSQ